MPFRSRATLTDRTLTGAGQRRRAAGDDVYGLVYVSRSEIPEDDAEAMILQLVAGAAARNAEVGITGALFFTGTHFAQAIEGARSAVEQMMTAIIFDPRHRDIVVMRACAEPARRFTRSSMAYGGYSPAVSALVARARLSGTAGFERIVIDLLGAMAPLPGRSEVSALDTQTPRHFRRVFEPMRFAASERSTG